MNTRELLKRAAEELRAAGVPDPEYDSAALLSEVTGKPPLELRMGLALEMTGEQEAAFQALMDRRRSREPLQYILGDTIFCGLEFKVGPGVLIPRPETEMMTLWASVLLQGASRPEILDLCCGSGCLGLSLKYLIPLSRVTMTDLSPEAVALSHTNREKLGLDCEILEGDLFAPVAGRRFDCIVSNPPYIPSAECETLQEEVTREPRMALDGGADGMDFYRRIAAEAPEYLKPGGALMMELGIHEAVPVGRMLTEHGAKTVEIRKDLARIDRMILATY